jgi:hypothetical protein
MTGDGPKLRSRCKGKKAGAPSASILEQLHASLESYSICCGSRTRDSSNIPTIHLTAINRGL